MRFAGVGLTREGYRIAVTGAEDGPSGAVEVYEHCGLEGPVARLAELAGESPDGFAVVLDSANGIMDAPLAALGIPVLRADPPLLTDGRTTARSLAALGRSHPEALTALPPDGWTMAGREDGIAAAEAASGPVERELAERGLLLAGGGGAAPLVALTFDDGPHPEYTPQVLDVLARFDAPAAFFCIGLHALAHPGVVRRIAAEGHTLGNHSWSHAYLPDLGPIGLREQLGFTADALARACGSTRPPRWLRPVRRPQPGTPHGGRRVGPRHGALGRRREGLVPARSRGCRGAGAGRGRSGLGGADARRRRRPFADRRRPARGDHRPASARLPDRRSRGPARRPPGPTGLTHSVFLTC